MDGPSLVRAGIAFLAAFPVGTLVEYFLHRFLLHSRARTFLSVGHGRHHQSNQAGTLLVDVRDFLGGVIPFGWLGFPFGIETGFGFLLGGIAFVFCLTVIHKWNHEHPGRVFWMQPNSHRTHHDRFPRRNFGITSHFWDRVFGTFARDPRP